MKRLLIALTAVCLQIAVYGQVVTKDSLSVIKPGSKLGYVLDFSDAVIMGMDEEAFSKYEPDWQEDKPTIVTNFMNGINAKLDGILVATQLKDLDYTVKVSVKNVTTKGFMLCNAVVADKQGNILFEVKQLTGGKEPPFSPGTKLAKMKVWATLTGRALGSIIRSEYLNQ